MFLLYFK